MPKKRARAVRSIKKVVPAMYPPPETVHLSPRKIVAFDPETRTVTLEGPVPTELLKAAELERWRLDIKSRLATYCETCLKRMEPYWGKRPKGVPRSKWLDQKLLIPGDGQDQVISLPRSAPGEIQDAHRALIAILWIDRCLISERSVSRRMCIAICMAIDLGQLLQRGQVQIDHGEAADRGRRNIESTRKAKEAKSRGSLQRSIAAEAEFNRLMANRRPRQATDTLKQMAEIKDANGDPKYGSFSQLKRYKKNWKRLTPTK